MENRQNVRLMTKPRIKAAILGTGNIGSDLLFKLRRQPGEIELALFAGIDPASDGLRRARELGIPTSHEGAEAIAADPEIRLVFDATSAKAHVRHAPRLIAAGKALIDLTPAALGPAVCPATNLGEHLEATDINLVTCGGQATIPLVHAVNQVAPLEYAELVSTVASASAGPGTRQNIDEFTVTTARGMETLGGAARAKALIILNPATPPIMMRNTIYLLPKGDFDEAAVTQAIERRAGEVRTYVPGYRVKDAPVFDEHRTPDGMRRTITLLLEVAGAGDYLPPYAGNLDIMTSAAWRVAQGLAARINPATS